MPSIFDYLDYRTYLADWYREYKASRKGVSYRALAAKVGFSSPGFFTQILQGKTNMGLETAQGFAELIGLKARPREFFLALVAWNQAKDPRTREKTWRKLRKLLDFKVLELTAEQRRFLGSWRHAAIREVLGIAPFRGDHEALARAVEPAITAEQARESVELLLALGLAARTSRGIERRDAALSAGTSVPEAVSGAFFRDLHRLGGEALERFPKADRNLSWVTFSASDAARDEILEELRQFRRRVLEIAARDERPVRVHQLTLLLHPLSRHLAAETRP